MSDFAIVLKIAKLGKPLETYIEKKGDTYKTGSVARSQNHLPVIIIPVLFAQYISLPDRIMSGEFKNVDEIRDYVRMFEPESASEALPVQAELRPLSDKELTQRERLRIKNEGLEDLPDLIPIVVRKLPIEFSDSKLRRGTVRLSSGLVLSGSWTLNNGIDRLEEVSITSPARKTTFLDILPIIRDESTLNIEFYRMLEYELGENPSLFFEKLKRQTKVRIIAACHGCILEPFKAPCIVHRMGIVPQGVCSFTNSIGKMRIMSTLRKIVEDHEFELEGQDYVTMQMREMCVRKLKPTHPEQKEHGKMVEQCSEREFSPEKIIGKGELMFNKNFESNPGLNFLCVGFLEDGKYTYKNLFSVVPSTITLKNIFEHFIPACTECVFIDFSCSKPCREGLLAEEDLSKYGGTRKKNKKNKKKKSKRIH
jgi:hypothetical protein